jgi:hypothetical protein
VSPMYTRLNRPPHACGHQDRSINNLWCNDCSNKLSDIEERCTAAVDVDTLVSLTETMTEYEPTPDQTSGAIEHMRHSGAALSLLADVDAFFSRAKMAQVSVAQLRPPPLSITHTPSQDVCIGPRMVHPDTLYLTPASGRVQVGGQGAQVPRPRGLRRLRDRRSPQQVPEHAVRSLPQQCWAPTNQSRQKARSATCLLQCS